MTVLLAVAFVTGGCQWSKDEYNKWFSMKDPERSSQQAKQSQQAGTSMGVGSAKTMEDLPPVDDEGDDTMIVVRERTAKILKWENRADTNGVYFQTGLYLEFEDSNSKQWVTFGYIPQVETRRIRLGYNVFNDIVDAEFLSDK